MPIKMSQLVKLTDTPKSTILYYIKEGLLPQPQKPKPNVHLYDESFIEKIRFIKYLQKNFNLSIEQLKQIMQRDEFKDSVSYNSLIDILDILMEPPHHKRYTLQELSQITNIEISTIKSYIDEGLIFERGDGFSDKEVEIISILNALEQIEGGKELIERYRDFALSTAEAEINLAKSLQENRALDGETLKSLFDATLILKPYLFNMRLYTEFQKKDSK